MDYKELNDNEIIYYIKDSIEEAKDILFEKYKPLIENIARRFLKYSSNIGLENNDLIQEGYLALNSAIETFDEQKNITFYTYAKNCIERKMISAIVKNNSFKHKVLNESISYEVEDSEGTHLLFGNILEDNNYNPLELILNKENEKNLISNIKEKLTELEAKVFDLKINGFSYKEIAEILDKDAKAIDNAIQRIKGKAKIEINNINS